LRYECSITMKNVTHEFWRFVEAVADNPEMTGDSIRESPVFDELKYVLSEAIEGEQDWVGIASNSLLPPPPPSPQVEPMPSGTLWDAGAEAYVFMDIEHMFYGVRDILELFGSTVIHEVWLQRVQSCISKILSFLDIMALSDDIEMGLDSRNLF